MAQEDDTPSPAFEFKIDLIDNYHLVVAERRIADGEYVGDEDLAIALRENGSRPIPAAVLDYLCRLLEGGVAKPKGRKAIPRLEMRRRRMIQKGLYEHHLVWLQRRKSRYGHLRGWPLIRQADWWKGPPHERAARMVAHRLSYGAASWRSVQNLVSSRK